MQASREKSLAVHRTQGCHIPQNYHMPKQIQTAQSQWNFRHETRAKVLSRVHEIYLDFTSDSSSCQGVPQQAYRDSSTANAYTSGCDSSNSEALVVQRRMGKTLQPSGL